MDIKKLAGEIFELVGGEGNIINVVHCATRLRFELKDNKNANKQEIENLEGVITVVETGSQFQVVIGNKVSDVYKELVKLGEFNNDNNDKGEKKKGKFIDKVFELISGTFTPLLAPLAGAGMLKALLTLLLTFGLISEASGTYAILNAAGNSVLYFLPIMIGSTLAKKLGANQYMGAVIGGALMEPSFTALLAIGESTSFMGIPVALMDYSSTLVPAFLAVLVYAKLEKLLKKIIHENVQLFLVPMLSLMIIVPLTVIVFGPIGIYAGEVVANVVNLLSERSGVLTGAVVGGGIFFFIMFGLHWALIPMGIENLLNGGDPIDPMWAAGTFAQMGVALGIFLKTRDKQVKSLAGSTGITGFLSGVTEPIIYGLILRYKRTIPYIVISGAIGGAIIGYFKGEAKAFVLHSVFTLGGSTTPWLPYLVTVVLSITIAASLTYFFGFEDKDVEKEEVVEKETSNNEIVKKEYIGSPLTGEVKKLNEVNDEVFSTGAMGKGVAIEPTVGKVFAPISGTISVLFPTKHAIGITTDNGAEILIHVGIDTVQLEGEHFISHIKSGDRIEKGDLLVEFNIEKIKEAGYETSTIVIITNSDDFIEIVEIGKGLIKANEDLLVAVK